MFSSPFILALSSKCLLVVRQPSPIIPHSSRLFRAKAERTPRRSLSSKASGEVPRAQVKDQRFFFVAVADRGRGEGGGECALGGMRGAGIGLKMGETGTDAGGGFPIEVACCCCHAYGLNESGPIPVTGYSYRMMSLALGSWDRDLGHQCDAQSRLVVIKFKCGTVPCI